MTRTARIRNQGSFADLDYDLTTINHGNNDSEVTSSNTIEDTDGQTKYMFDHVIPGYDRLSKSGVVIVNPMHSTVTTRDSTASGMVIRSLDSNGDPTYSYVRGGGHILLSDETTSTSALGLVQHMYMDIDIEQLNTLAGTAAQANINPPEFQGVVFIAELRETLGFLLSPLRAYQKWVKRRHKEVYRIRARQRRKLGKAFKEDGLTLADFISKNWLAYRYGVLPIIYDIHDAVDAIMTMPFSFQRHTARGFAKNYGEDSWTQTNPSGKSVNATKDIDTRRDVEVRAGVLYKYNVHDSFGVEMNEIPKAAWEVVPFSFVADWFVNINDFIGAISPKSGVTVLGSWTTRKDTTVTTASGSVVGNPDRQDFDMPTTSSSVEKFTTEHKLRHPGNSVGLASRPIPFDGALGKKRIADTLALTFQLLNSKV